MKNITYDKWLPFDGDYEKQECDIMLRNGIILKHFYPNAGKFGAMCDLVDTQYEKVPAQDVVKVMYRKYYLDDLCTKNNYCCNSKTDKDKAVAVLGAAGFSNLIEEISEEDKIASPDAMTEDQFLDFKIDYMHPLGPGLREPRPPIVKEKRPGRNDPCDCGSGIKYKKCCINK